MLERRGEAVNEGATHMYEQKGGGVKTAGAVCVRAKHTHVRTKGRRCERRAAPCGPHT